MKLPRTYYNPTSLAGTILAAVSALIIVFFMIAMTFFEGDASGAYVGIFSYIILPVFLIIGLILIPIGMARRSKRIKREGEDSVVSKIVLDLSNQRHWNAVGLFILISILFLLLTGIGSYKAFHYTESNKFCGTLCHSVMEPEYTAYQESAHSRVTCVECHVGEGAKWYVRSKLSGLYQVYSVTFNKYPTPIETPIHNLRPARETCEECHWPEKFYSQNLRTEKNFLADSANTEWDIQLKMKIGSEHSARGLMEGIHWHINSDVKIEYISSSDKREYIPWVRFVNRATGDTTVYQDINEPLEQEAMDTLEMREMDCLDCHNRPSHQFLPPQKFTDDLIAAGVIPVELPEVKSLAMQVFNYNTFTDRDSGAVLIAESVRDFYDTGYPEIADAHPELIDRAIEGFLSGYDKNYFPKMKANWDAYPNHIGHSEFNGCFRCHNGNHESEDGSVISRDCNLCHTIVGQGSPDNFETSTVDIPLEFRHPVDIDEAWKEMACADCHRYLY
jgi:nitrate/TMAO reductase-like tetraheme cytochrome c subunit